ncbi:MAG TPA: hypothetical protein VEL76_08170 [Gemmataceae bacterium]|nr:hypothetical protein [Gemmataceae bacterium]
MNDFARQKLSELLTTYGRGLCDEPKRLRALLSDLCPGRRGEVHVLSTALEQGVPQELANASDDLPFQVLVARLSRRLVEEAALTEKAARWAVETWAAALGWRSERTAAGRLQISAQTESELLATERPARLSRTAVQAPAGRRSGQRREQVREPQEGAHWWTLVALCTLLIQVAIISFLLITGALEQPPDPVPVQPPPGLLDAAPAPPPGHGEDRKRGD